MTVPSETSSRLSNIPDIKHGFFGRVGGVSLGPYRGLNVGLGSDDNPTHIAENRKRVLAALDGAAGSLSTVRQIHSNICVVADQAIADNARPEADALVTDQPHIALSVLTADCCPVLFADPSARVIGAAHAGWRGAVRGILENTISAMEQLGADKTNIIAAIGPTISAEHYEVGADFQAEVMSHDSYAAPYFRSRADWPKPHFDLPGYVENRLRRSAPAGIDRIRPGCTYADPNRYFSYRRGCHQGETDYGRQVATICLSA